jgi:hypothetical protein
MMQNGGVGDMPGRGGDGWVDRGGWGGGMDIGGGMMNNGFAAQVGSWNDGSWSNGAAAEV